MAGVGATSMAFYIGNGLFIRLQRNIFSCNDSRISKTEWYSGKSHRKVGKMEKGGVAGREALTSGQRFQTCVA